MREGVREGGSEGGREREKKRGKEGGMEGGREGEKREVTGCMFHKNTSCVFPGCKPLNDETLISYSCHSYLSLLNSLTTGKTESSILSSITVYPEEPMEPG